MKNGYELLEEGPMEQDIVYDIDYYDFHIESWAVSYAKQQSGCMPSDREEKTFSLSGFDTAAYYGGNWDQNFILRADTVVIIVHYRETGDLWKSKDLFSVQ